MVKCQLFGNSSLYNCNYQEVGILYTKITILFNINTLSTFSISVGVREKGSSKIKIIKGSKNIFDILPNKSLYIINSTVLYSAESGDEICLITDINNKIKINSNKSIIKILTL
jgi:hypothetical protein